MDRLKVTKRSPLGDLLPGTNGVSYLPFIVQISVRWNKISDVSPQRLPMSLELENLEPRIKYHFAVRAVDEYNRFTLSNFQCASNYRAHD
jgi:hypothetical protein